MASTASGLPTTCCTGTPVSPRGECGKPGPSWLRSLRRRGAWRSARWCCAVPFRNPAILAKMATSADEVSSGRLILGIGAGWNEPEYQAFGLPFDHRAARFDEAMQIITPLLRDGYVDFEGQYYQARDCEVLPRGPRPAGPPLLIGSEGPRMRALTARYADL